MRLAASHHQAVEPGTTAAGPAARQLVGLTAIPPELQAAAETDGTRRAWDRFTLVTWPMLGPTTLFVVTITAIRCLRVLDTVAALTKSGPNKASEMPPLVLLQARLLERQVLADMTGGVQRLLPRA